MRPGKKLLILAVPLAALAIAGCGGGGGDETTDAPVATVEEPTAISQEELLAAGDGICAETNAAVGTIGANEAEGESQAVQIAEVYSGMVENIKELGEPEDEAGYADFIEAADALAAAEDEAKLAGEREDAAALEEAQASAAAALSDFQSAAAAYGFEQCSEGPSVPVAPGGSEPPVEGEEEIVPEEEVAPEEEIVPEVEEEEVAPEEGGGAGVAPEEGGAPESGGGSGGIGPG
jgi:hypothetical protein